MKKANWIWIKNAKERDEYVRFYQTFSTSDGSGKVTLALSCDSIYNVWVNGKLVGFGMMYDYEHYKTLEKYDITQYCKTGENRLEVLVWHLGNNTYCYRAESAGLYYEITDEKGVIAVSDESTKCKFDEKYVRGREQMMTGAIGYTYQYDNANESVNPLENAVTVDKRTQFASADTRPLRLGDFVSGKIVQQEKGKTVIDLGKECFGYLSFTIISPENAKPVRVAFGEHLKDGNVILSFDKQLKYIYAVDYVAKEGKNEFTGLLRALGCRYLQFIYEGDLEVQSAGVYPLYYPFDVRPFTLQDETEQKIYDTALHTMMCCTHKHYIDCPWREQSMYILDARNEMLFGYYAFKNTELARYNLIFLAKGLLDCGLLPSCPPARHAPIIPYFNLAYFLQVWEYIKYTGDETVIDEVLPTLTTILNTFNGYLDKQTGLLKRLSAPPYWNFYEWTEGNAHWAEKSGEGIYDVILNCTFVMAVECYQKILALKGETYSFDLEEMRKNIRLTLYDEEKGLFKNDNTETVRYSRMGNGLAILANVVDKQTQKKIAETIAYSKNLNTDSFAEELSGKKKCEEDKGVEIVDVSLSAAIFYYDALLQTDDKYKDYVRRDIREKYVKMLEGGATTFWETLIGADDFGGCGSLCHAWSAIPVYYYHRLELDKRN